MINFHQEKKIKIYLYFNAWSEKCGESDMSICKWGGAFKIKPFNVGGICLYKNIFLKMVWISHFLLKSIDSWKWEILIIMKLFECRAIKCNLSYGRVRVKILWKCWRIDKCCWRIFCASSRFLFNIFKTQITTS